MDVRSWGITTTVDTRDAVALEEVGRMFTRLATRATLAEGAPEETARGLDTGRATTREETAVLADPQKGIEWAIGAVGILQPAPVTEAPAVDAATAFQAAAPAPVDASAAFSGGPAPTVTPAVRTDCDKLQPGTIFCTVLGEREDGCGTCSAFAPLAPAAAVVPPVPTVAPPAASGPVLDTDGLPWDARINTSNKVTRKDGVWKRVPGITDELYNGVIAELKAAMGAAAPQQHFVDPNAYTAPPAATPPPAPAPAPAPAGEEAVPSTFTDLIACVTKRTGAIPPKITPDEVNAACAIISGGAINNLALLINRTDLIPTAYAEMKKIWDTRA